MNEWHSYAYPCALALLIRRSRPARLPCCVFWYGPRGLLHLIANL